MEAIRKQQRLVELQASKEKQVRDNLVKAAKEGHLGEVERLLGLLTDPYNREWGGSNVTEVNAVDSCGWTALHAAATHDRDVVATHLLAQKANPNLANKYGRTPMHAASIYGHSNLISILLESKGDINAGDSKGRTPLHEAALNGHEKIVETFINTEGTRILANTTRGWDPSQEAASRGNTELAARIKAFAVSKKKA